MTDTNAEAPYSATVSMVVTRADGTVVDLGVVSAHYSDKAAGLRWRLVGKPLAERRIRKANRQIGA